MKHLSIDIETYSSVDIRKSGLYRYAQAPDFEILLFAYSVDGAPVQIVDLKNEEQIPEKINTALYDGSVIKHAYNAAFEWYCLSRHFHKETLLKWLSQWQCTMLHGLYCGYTAGLAATAAALGLSQDKRKMSVGGALIRTFCKPVKPTKSNGGRTRTLPNHEPEKWDLFKEYCVQDVIVEMEIEKRLENFPVPPAEQMLWQLDQRINACGVCVDETMIDSAQWIDKEITSERVFVYMNREDVERNCLQRRIKVTNNRSGMEKKLIEAIAKEYTY